MHTHTHTFSHNVILTVRTRGTLVSNSLDWTLSTAVTHNTSVLCRGLQRMLEICECNTTPRTTQKCTLTHPRVHGSEIPAKDIAWTCGFLCCATDRKKKNSKKFLMQKNVFTNETSNTPNQRFAFIVVVNWLADGANCHYRATFLWLLLPLFENPIKGSVYNFLCYIVVPTSTLYFTSNSNRSFFPPLVCVGRSARGPQWCEFNG